MSRLPVISGSQSVLTMKHASVSSLLRIIVFAMLFLLFIKIFPCVSVAETLQGEPAAAHPELEEDAAATSATEVQHA